MVLVGCSSGTLSNDSADLGGTTGTTGPGLTTALPQSSTSGSSASGSASSTSSPPGTGTVEPDATSSSSTGATADTAPGSSSGGDLPVLASCADLLAFEPALTSGVYTIDPDGPGEIAGLDVYCDMETSGGGWTLVMVSSDDGNPTWTWVNRTLMTTNQTPVGAVEERNLDYKSIALHSLVLTDLLFVHEPSGIWAAYEGLGASGDDLGTFMDALPSPNCDVNYPGNGFPMTDGTLTVEGALCDTDLYFHPGDWDGLTEVECADQTRVFNNPTFGPAWNRASNGDCPFDDPINAGLGPSPLCIDCEAGQDMVEIPAAGFGAALMLNTGTPGRGENYLQVYVR